MNQISKVLFGALLSAGFVASVSADNFGPRASSGKKGNYNNPGGDDPIIWDQTAFDGGDFVDQNFGDFPTFSTFMVDDFTTGQEIWNVTSVHTFMTTNAAWLNGNVNSAQLSIYKKGGALPDNANDTPSSDSINVPITITDLGNGSMELAATGLNLPELTGLSGDYWVGLTPNADFGAFGQAFHLLTTPMQFGDEAAVRNQGGGFGFAFGPDWGTVGAGLGDGSQHEMAFKLDGVVVPAPGAAALLGLGGLVAGRRRRN